MADHESAILCDLAEYYHIYNWRDFDIGYIATLVCGLQTDSRTMREISNMQFTLDTLLTAIMADYLSSLLYVEIKKSTKKSVPQPKSLFEILKQNQTVEDAKEEMYTFRTPEEFEMARQRILEG